MSTLTEIVERCGAHGLTLHRASPRGADRLVLGLRDRAGAVVAGQWHLDRARAAEVAQRTWKVAGPGDVAHLVESGIVLQRRGADRRLPGLKRLLDAPGSVLVTHRAERRGVVRLADGSYAKAVVPEKVQDLARALAARADTAALVTPKVLDVDEQHGTVRTAALPGRTLERRLADPNVPDHEVATDASRVGAALREFHDRPLDPTRPTVHDAAAELRVTRRWLDAAAVWGLGTGAWTDALDAVATRLAGPPEPLFPVHRDLHDKQLVVEHDAPVGLLDLDLVSAGEPALDLANLAVHLELRHLQGRCNRARTDRCTAGLLEGYDPTAQTLDRVPAYAASTRLRLVGVYAFRAAPVGLLERLLASARA